jgi:hypothetical protein
MVKADQRGIFMEENKYSRWYAQLIARSANRRLKKYYERHHIIPRAIGGNNDPVNLVKLTYREHFIAHWLLTKFTTGRARIKMLQALHCMSRRRNKKLVSSWQYARSQKANLEAKLGKKHTRAHRAKISASLLGNTHTLGYTHTAATRKKVSTAMKRLKSTPENRMKMSLVNKGNTYCLGYKHTDAARAKISRVHKGRKFTSEHRAKISVARQNYFAKRKAS